MSGLVREPACHVQKCSGLHSSSCHLNYVILIHVCDVTVRIKKQSQVVAHTLTHSLTHLLTPSPNDSLILYALYKLRPLTTYHSPRTTYAHLSLLHVPSLEPLLLAWTNRWTQALPTATSPVCMWRYVHVFDVHVSYTYVPYMYVYASTLDVVIAWASLIMALN